MTSSSTTASPSSKPRATGNLLRRSQDRHPRELREIDRTLPEKNPNRGHRRFERPLLPPNVRTRPCQVGDKTLSYEVVMDVMESGGEKVIAYGILTLPKDLDLTSAKDVPSSSANTGSRARRRMSSASRTSMPTRPSRRGSPSAASSPSPRRTATSILISSVCSISRPSRSGRPSLHHRAATPPDHGLARRAALR